MKSRLSNCLNEEAPLAEKAPLAGVYRMFVVGTAAQTAGKNVCVSSKSSKG
ncbi:MAG: hypothetical protein QME42_06020 [bacterium]|nr:hypothetical protein [bacterium]